MERETRVEVYRIDYLCDDCGFPMKYSYQYGESPIVFVHECTNESCMHETHLTDKEYPHLDYKDVIE